MQKATLMKFSTPSRLILVASRLVLLLSFLWTVIAPTGYTVQAATASPVAGAAWYDGLIQYSTITNCVSIIQGSPYTRIWRRHLCRLFGRS